MTIAAGWRSSLSIGGRTPYLPAEGAFMTDIILSVVGVAKTYGSGTTALHPTDLSIRRGEIFALLGPNGAGKTTLISIICGIVTPSAGTITLAGHDAIRDYKAARRIVGLVPQELSVDMFETVLATVKFSRRLFGRSADDAHIEAVLRDLSLWDKRDAKIRELSGGMKRRVLIAKALAHEPEILFLDEPTAGVDVALRRDMWALVHKLRAKGTTIILTTHYIEEAEEMADRVGVIAKGQLLLVDDKAALMKKLGKRELDLALVEPLEAVPAGLEDWAPSLEHDGHTLRYIFDATEERTGIPSLLRKLGEMGIAFKDLETSKSSLEDIFVDLVKEQRA
jgi:ABC-2 type transport system ATP-binding protein